MEFKYLTDKEFEALSEYQREKYLDEKRQHEVKVAKEAATNAAKEAAKEAIDAYKAEAEKEVEAKIEESVKQYKVIAEESERKMEAAQAAMNRIKEERNGERKESLVKNIEDSLKDEATQKNWLEMKAGSKTGVLSNFELKAPAASMAFPVGANRDQWARMVDIPNEQIHVRDIVPVTSTTAQAIKFIQWQYGADGNLITYVPQGGLKPQFEFIPVPKTVNVVKVAGHITVNDELFDDMEGARASIARQLPQALYDVEDAQMLRLGTGGDDQLDSVWNNATDWSPQGTVTATSNVWDKIVAAHTIIARAKGRATAAWISPEAYQELLINKDLEQAYTYPVVMGNDAVLRVGNIPVFFHNAFAANEGIVGNFYGATELFQRKGVEVRYSRDHADNFTHNRTTVLVEVREAFAIYKPYEFVRMENLVPEGGATPEGRVATTSSSKK